MSRDGFLSLCAALQKVEAHSRRSVQLYTLPPIRISGEKLKLTLRRPSFHAFLLPRKPVQSELPWPTDQMFLFGKTF
jgi:hypothetical protein